MRPDEITVNLYQSTSSNVNTSGTPYRTVKLNESNGWKHTWTDLPKQSGNKTYYYDIKEVSVDNYESDMSDWTGNAEDGYEKVMTNTIDWDTTIKVTKNWKDWDDDLGARPDEITVKLYRGEGTSSEGVSTSGTPYKTAVLNEGNNWSYTFTDLPKKKENTIYSYAVAEVSVDNYDCTASALSGNAKDGYTVTLTNKLNVGYLKLHKDSALPDMIDGNKCYSLEGAEYTVYETYGGDGIKPWHVEAETQIIEDPETGLPVEQTIYVFVCDACGWTVAETDYQKGEVAINSHIGSDPKFLSDPVGVLTTDGNGDTDTMRLLCKTYYVKETKAPTGFWLDNTIYKVTITEDHTEISPYLLELNDYPMNDPAGIRITKIQNGGKDGSAPILSRHTVYYPLL